MFSFPCARIKTSRKKTYTGPISTMTDIAFQEPQLTAFLYRNMEHIQLYMEGSYSYLSERLLEIVETTKFTY